MTRRLGVVVAWLAVSGCVWPNPEFEPASVGGSGDGGSSAGGGTSGTSAGTSAAADPTPTGGSATGSGGSPGPACQSDADCDDGEFCDGVEACEGSVCVAGAAPCAAPEVCDEAEDRCAVPCEVDADLDDDGVDGVGCGGTDCDDGDPSIHPGAQEVCAPDTIDEDCDPSTLGGLDADGDGEVSNECCNPDGQGGLTCGSDCDDANAGIGLGDWAHCGACDASCGAQQACEGGACVAARRVFVTSTTHHGNLGGLAGADGTCQARADAVGLGGVFKAYIVDGTGDLNRLEHPEVPFVRLDGVRIADGWGDLSDQSVKAPLALTETRQLVGGNAWTGLFEVNGSFVNNHCSNWSATPMCSANSPCGGAGEAMMADNHWDGFFIFNCIDQYRLYCVEQ